MPRTIAERLVALQTRSATIDAELTAINDNAEAEESRDFTADELATMDALQEEKKSLSETVRILTATEAQMAARAVPANGPGRGLIPAQVATKEPPGLMLAKIAAVTALSHITRQPVEAIIAKRYANDERVGAGFEYLQRTATNIADTTTPGWAAEMVRQDVGAFMADLETLSVFAALRARASTAEYTFDGVGSISIPYRNNYGNLAGAWVGETGVIPVLQGTIAAIKLEPTKLAGITAFSKELVNATNNQIETTLRNGMRMDTADFLDAKLLDAVAKVTGVRPAGLQVGANSAASGGPDAVAADLDAALAPILAARGGADIVLLMNTRQATSLRLAENALGMPLYPEMEQGNLKGFGFITSNNVPAGTVFVMDAAAFASAAGLPEFDVSEEATLTMANADNVAPTQATADGTVMTPTMVPPDGGIHVAGGATGPATLGVVAMNMFQQWSVALRLVLPVNWAMTRAQMVSVITGVAWGTA